jgi:hypothetical protein
MPMNAMPRHATTEPERPTAAAAPCKRCQTTGGRPHRNSPIGTPSRPQGYCQNCYAQLWLLCRDHGYGTLDEADTARPRGSLTRNEIAVANQHARVWERQEEIRDQLGPFITVAIATGRDASPVPDSGRWGGYGGACDPAWQPAPWYTPLAQSDATSEAA